MSKKSVIFYGIHSDFFQVAYKIIEKMYATQTSVREPVLFLCDNEEEVSFYNSKLWSAVQLSFIPSGNKNTIPECDAIFCYVWFSTEITFINKPTCLIHNGMDISNFDLLDKFQKIIDIFNIDLIEQAKQRFPIYQQNGFLDTKLWIQTDNSWKQEQFL